MVNLEKEKIQLTGEQETLLITLLAKADPDRSIFFDPKAKEIAERVDYDFRQLKMPYKTTILVGQRARKMDETVLAFLVEHPQATVLHLGCGLDSRFWRVDNGSVRWFDLDLPDVAALREKFYSLHERYTLLATSVTDAAWMDAVEWDQQPVLVVAEGLLMYLPEADVKNLFLQLREHFPGCRIIADAFSTLAAKSATSHASLKKTGANLFWGVDDPHEVETWGAGINLIEEWYFSDDSEIDQLPFGYRFGYKLAGLFKAANRAHRILYYQL